MDEANKERDPQLAWVISKLRTPRGKLVALATGSLLLAGCVGYVHEVRQSYEGIVRTVSDIDYSALVPEPHDETTTTTTTTIDSLELPFQATDDSVPETIPD